MRRPRWEFGARIAALAALAFGAPPGAFGAPSDADGSYTVLEALPSFTLDPARMTWDHDLRLANALFDGLVRWNPETFDIEPGVAERWERSPDGLVYTFHLREAARWSTGEPIVASDFVYSWRRLLTPDTAGDYAALLFAVRGGREWFDARAELLREYGARPAPERTLERAIALRARTDAMFAERVGVEAVDARTFRVTLDRPVAYFLEVCAYVPTFVVHAPSVEAFVRVNAQTGRIEQQAGWTKPPALISSGAYRLSRWRFRQDMLLERNERYWDAARVRAPRVTVRVIEDPNTRALAFQTGGGDWNTDLLVDYLPDMLREAGSDPGASVHAYRRFGTYFWSFNCRDTLGSGRENPLRDPRVRRALSMATDKAAIASSVRGLGEEPAGTLIPPGAIRGYDEARVVGALPFDPDGARALLAEAGWARRDQGGPLTDVSGAGRGEFPALDILCPAGSYHQNVALALGAGWERALGVRSRVDARDSRAVRESVRRGEFMVARAGWFGDFEDPSSFLRILRTGDGNNDRGYSNPEFDALFDRADAEQDALPRLALFARAEALAMGTDAPILPLWRFSHFYQFDPARLRGVSAHPRLMQRFDRIWLEPEPAAPGDRP